MFGRLLFAFTGLLSFSFLLVFVLVLLRAI